MKRCAISSFAKKKNKNFFTVMAHSLAGAPLLVRTSNGALRPDAPLVCMEKWKKINTSGAPCFWCAISVFHTNGASPTGAPLVYSSGALLPWCTISINPIYSPFPSSVGHAYKEELNGEIT